jgi:2-phosphosulfolactate phosphatase
VELLNANLEVLFSPAEFDALHARNLTETVCVVFDVLRATSSMITALANGSTSIIPVAEISEAIDLRRKNPHILLAGERGGVRIEKDLTGSIGFDFGNSPREFTKERVENKTIALSTTNGTRALRACATAKLVVAASFLNLTATAEFLLREPPENLLLICGGTYEQAAYEDVLGAGALCDLVWHNYIGTAIADSSLLSRIVYEREHRDLAGAFAKSRNGQRLLTRRELADDVAFCAEKDRFGIVAALNRTGEMIVISS